VESPYSKNSTYRLKGRGGKSGCCFLSRIGPQKKETKQGADEGADKVKRPNTDSKEEEDNETERTEGWQLRIQPRRAWNTRTGTSSKLQSTWGNISLGGRRTTSGTFRKIMAKEGRRHQQKTKRKGRSPTSRRQWSVEKDCFDRMPGPRIHIVGQS